MKWTKGNTIQLQREVRMYRYCLGTCLKRPTCKESNWGEVNARDNAPEVFSDRREDTVQVLPLTDNLKLYYLLGMVVLTWAGKQTWMDEMMTI
jgi:hypothetical protein